MNRMNNPEEKIVVITGATSGIGLATAGKMAGKGAIVIGVGRSSIRCGKAESKIITEYPDAKVQYFVADLSSLKQVRELAEQIRDAIRNLGKNHIDVLVNNAGTFSSWYVSTPEGFELQFAVNHLASFLLTRKLLPLLEYSTAGKVITVSSGSHYRTRMHWKDVMMRRHYNCLSAYKQSKLANVLFTKELNRRLGPDSTVRAYAVDPGLVNTDIGLKGTAGIVKWVWEKRKRKGTSAQIPASTITYLIENPDVHNSWHIYWKDCKPKAPSRYSQRDKEAIRLWELSEKMCGLSGNGFQFPV